LEAAEEVRPKEGIERDGVVDLLSRLVDKSLVLAEASAEGESRYRMLEPVRQYDQERLEESGEAEQIRKRPAEYYLALAEGADAQEAERGVNAARPVAWLKRMESEHANLSAPLSWSLDKDDEPDCGRAAQLGLRLAVALWWFWHTHDSQIEGRRYLEKAASSTSSDPASAYLRARASDAAAELAIHQGDYGASKALMEEGLALYRELGDEGGIAAGLTYLGMAAVLGHWGDISLPEIFQELMELKPRLDQGSHDARLSARP